MTDKEKFEAWLKSTGQNPTHANKRGYWAIWQAALASQQPADDGWIDWVGGECPVGQNQGVDVKLRGGYGDQFYGNPASYFEWSHDGLGLDIIAYRVVKP